MKKEHENQSQEALNIEANLVPVSIEQDSAPESMKEEVAQESMQDVNDTE